MAAAVCVPSCWPLGSTQQFRAGTYTISHATAVEYVGTGVTHANGTGDPQASGMYTIAPPPPLPYMNRAERRAAAARARGSRR